MYIYQDGYCNNRYVVHFAFVYMFILMNKSMAAFASQNPQRSERPTPLSLLSLNRGHHLPRMSARSELQIPNTLPGSCRQLPIRNRNRNTRTHQRTLDMSRHIIQPLRRMPIQVPLPILRCNPIQRITHIGPDILIPILVQTQCATRMLDKQIQQSYFVVFDLGKRGDDVVGYEVAAPGLGGEGEGFLAPGQGAGGWGSWRWEGG